MIIDRFDIIMLLIIIYLVYNVKYYFKRIVFFTLYNISD